MATNAEKAMGVTIAYADDATEEIGEVTAINGVGVSATSLDATVLTSPDGMKQAIQGLRSGKAFTVEGNYAVGDAGQLAVWDHFNNDDDGGNRALTITGPATCAFKLAFEGVHVTDIGAPGNATVDGLIPFSVQFTPSGTVEFTDAA